MTLDDFFTLTEMNNGLAAHSRVRELMVVMEKERSCIAKNAADSTRQWSAVASALVATQNKDCLDLFLELDGLNFISKWLKDAQKFNDDSFVEESITHLLSALEKLDVDHEKLLASGIWETLQNLRVHNNSKVQDKARALIESWVTKTDSSTSIPDVEKAGALTVGESNDIERGMGHSESPPRDASICQENSVNGKGNELDKADLSTSSNAPELVESTHNLDKSLNLPIGDEGSLNHVDSSSLQKSTMESPLCSPVNTTSDPCVAAAPSQDTINTLREAASRQETTLNTQKEVHESESSNYTEQQPVKIESLPDKVGLLENSKGRSFTSSSLVSKEVKSVAESSRKNSTCAETKTCDEGVSCVDPTEKNTDANGVEHKVDGSNQCKTPRAFMAGDHHMLPRSSNSEKSWGNPKDLGVFLSGTEDKGRVNAPGLRVTENNRTNNYTFGKKLMNRGADRAAQKSDVEIDYGIVDPLEVARQVAMEVEREVVDSREPSCSSSEKLRQRNSPESVSEKQSESSEGGSSKEVVNESNSSDESSSPMQQQQEEQDMATSQLTEVAQGGGLGLCEFDLNEEVCSEDAENQLFAAVSFVSASRAAAAPGLPGPLEFEGNLGWKGSAVTSAFRPASPRHKQQQQRLDFDLNVADELEAPDTKPHVEFFPAAISRRSEHLALDLNHSSENAGGALLDWRIGRSSQYPSKQPTTRNIDLNDQPTFLNDPYPTTSTYVSPVVSQTFKSDDSAISIMGKRVEVDRKELIAQPPALANGRTSEVPFEFNLGRTGNLLGIGSSYGQHSPAGYGYTTNIAAVHHTPPPMPFPSTIYGSGGPIPYMMDSRGQPVFPQIVGSASALPTAAYSQPSPFMVNLNMSAPSNSSRGSFDLNSGMLLESGSKEGAAGFGLFLNSGQGSRSVDEQLRPNPPQPTMSSVFSGKRKEPESGWENYPFKHYTPPWKQS